MRLKFWEKFKGFVQKTTSRRAKPVYPMEYTWVKRCKHFDDMYERHSLAKSQCLTIAGQGTSNGVFLKAADLGDVHKQRAEQAKRACEELNKKIKIRKLIFDTMKNMAKRGSFFWEKSLEPFNVRAVPQQRYICPGEVDPVDGVLTWKQRIRNVTVAEWTSSLIVHNAWDVTDKSWPFGTSLIVGLETEFDTLQQLEVDIKEYMHKNAFPKEVASLYDKDYVTSDSEVSDVRGQFRSWEPGESIITNFPFTYTAAGTGDRKIESLDTVLGFIKEQIVDGTLVPPISKQYNATEASAKEMMPFFHANIIDPMHEIISINLQAEVYNPYLESLGFSVKLCPDILWEPPDADREETAKYYKDLVDAQIMPPQVAADALGFGDEHRVWRKEQDRREQEQQQLQKTQPMNQQANRKYTVIEHTD